MFPKNGHFLPKNGHFFHFFGSFFPKTIFAEIDCAAKDLKDFPPSPPNFLPKNAQFLPKNDVFFTQIDVFFTFFPKFLGRKLGPTGGKTALGRKGESKNPVVARVFGDGFSAQLTNSSNFFPFFPFLLFL